MSNSKRMTNIKLSKYVKPITNVSSKYSIGYRYIRADSEPNWSQRVKEKSGDAGLLASKPAITISPNSTILEALEKMSSYNVRGLIISDSRTSLKGIIMATDLVNYLGGGEFYNIIQQRYNKNLFNALQNEKVSNIMNTMPVFVKTTQKLTEIIKLMAINNLGMLPVIDDLNRVVGVITEHDIVKHIIYKDTGKKVSSIMTSNIVSAYENDTLKRAAQLMSLYGFRRIPVISTKENEIIGIVSAKDFVNFFGSHEVFKNVSSYNIEDVLSLQLTLIMKKEINTINENADIGEAATEMINRNTNSLIVINDNNEAVGIITERDLLMSLAMR
ncbi:CBS domain-containing protein [Caldisphaera lagunensis DSM 15908]|uniref:CBS domain-containing protein n=1 Tax=Caldisphaera lagunensis (strain DSM 15908 / JCM 11604 / ANMR 0165 / IC-154) TaxID=1056495 RepID=L0ABF2_CALLD|nr:CBS domain-containing protein [Caldisphaera lagunensis]AFZ71186.1 CBS domain-containing protein [Caldisphaera lagunensis DSM 15908]